MVWWTCEQCSKGCHWQTRSWSQRSEFFRTEVDYLLYSKIAILLTWMLHMNAQYVWKDDENEAFEMLKRALMRLPLQKFTNRTLLLFGHWCKPVCHWHWILTSGWRWETTTGHCIKNVDAKPTSILYEEKKVSCSGLLHEIFLKPHMWVEGVDHCWSCSIDIID